MRTESVKSIKRLLARIKPQRNRKSHAFRACLAMRLNLCLIKFQFFFFAKIKCGLYFLDCFDVLMSMKKHHWHVFQHEKLFEKQPLPYC